MRSGEAADLERHWQCVKAVGTDQYAKKGEFQGQLSRLLYYFSGEGAL